MFNIEHTVLQCFPNTQNIIADKLNLYQDVELDDDGFEDSNITVGEGIGPLSMPLVSRSRGIDVLICN